MNVLWRCLIAPAALSLSACSLITSPLVAGVQLASTAVTSVANMAPNTSTNGMAHPHDELRNLTLAGGAFPIAVGGVLRDHPAQGEAAEGAGRIEGGFQVHAADVLEIDVDALGRDLGQFGGRVGGGSCLLLIRGGRRGRLLRRHLRGLACLLGLRLEVVVERLRSAVTP